MTFERTLIQAFSALPRSPMQRNAPFTSDAEIVEIGGTILALSIDEFSEEDSLGYGGPFEFGRNVAIAAMSDLIAVGAEPRHLLQSVAARPDVETDWLRAFADGLSVGLETTGCTVIGGDAGTANEFRFTATVIGEFGDSRPVTRVLTQERGKLAVTGTLGDVNLAALNHTPVRIECRLAEMRQIAPCAAIDTSDGLVHGLCALAEVNPHTSFSLKTDDVPYTADVSALPMGIPREALLFGSAGEYELLVCLPADAPQAAGFTVIGEFGPGSGAWINGRRHVEPELDPRVLSRADYVSGLVTFATTFLEGAQ